MPVAAPERICTELEDDLRQRAGKGGGYIGIESEEGYFFKTGLQRNIMHTPGQILPDIKSCAELIVKKEKKGNISIQASSTYCAMDPEPFQIFPAVSLLTHLISLGQRTYIRTPRFLTL